MSIWTAKLVSGDEAVAMAALDADVALGTGYPGTPSTEILETMAAMGGKAQWAPNEKVALEVAVGASLAGARTLVTMKHVGVNVAADMLFTVTYSGIDGALVLVSADDPGMSSSQNEQDNRRYAVAAGVPMFEPADSQEAYDLTLAAFGLSQRWRIPVMLRMTTRVCHGKSILRCRQDKQQADRTHFQRDIPGRVMIPAHARPAHRRLRQKLAEIEQWNETCPLNKTIPGDRSLGIISSGVAFLHSREASPKASALKLAMTYPLPMGLIRKFAASVDRCVVIEEGDPYLADAIRAAGVGVESKAEMYRFGELNVTRARRIISNDTSPEAPPLKGKPPELCAACPYRQPFGILKKLDCIVAGDIGCYTLGALPPLAAMDTQLCMGASLGVGLGLRHVLPEAEARKVVSVIGDSTFMHSGLTGLVEMVYNPPPTGHVLLILDNGTTAMTGQQEHPATGRKLGHEQTNRVKIEEVCKAIGVQNVDVLDPVADPDGFEKVLTDRLSRNELSVIIARRACILAAGKIRKYEQETQASRAQCEPVLK